MKKAFILIAFLMALHIFTLSVHAVSLGIDAQAYILVDSKTGQILYEQNPDKKLYPASTTKIMTAVLALENGSPGQIMTASKQAVYDIGKDGMNIGIMPDEKIPMINLLEALLISSANETANIIAENICSSRDEFVKLMNKRAQELGAVNTHFVNPCGAHNSEHYTTAKDFAAIARYAMTLDAFREIAGKKEYKMPITNKHSEWPVLYSSNLLLRNPPRNASFRINGIKTGYTGEAGQNLVSSAVNDDGMELIAVVLGVMYPDNQRSSFNYSFKLLEYGFNNYSMQKLCDANQKVVQIQVADAKDNAVLDLVTSKEFKCALPIDKSLWNIEKKDHIASDIIAPVNKGDKLGYIEYMQNGVSLGKVEIIASNSVEGNSKPEFTSATKKIAGSILSRNVFAAIIVCLLAFIILRTVLRIISRRTNRRIFRRKY